MNKGLAATSAKDTRLGCQSGLGLAHRDAPAPAIKYISFVLVPYILFSIQFSLPCKYTFIFIKLIYVKYNTELCALK